MATKLPQGIAKEHLLNAIAKIAKGLPHSFGDSTGYDVLHDGKRYAPKAVVGLAASQLLGMELGPRDFKGGIGTQCFSILQDHGFNIISKGDTHPFPDEIHDGETHVEGATTTVTVVRYERDPDARKKCIAHYGPSCSVCGMKFVHEYGSIGEGFIHVHHLVPLSQINSEYAVDPIRDLRPVCPNCHAMLHKRIPPYTIEELRKIRESQ